MWPAVMAFAFWKRGGIGLWEKRWLVGSVVLAVSYVGFRIWILEDPFGGETPWQDNPLQRATTFERMATAIGLLGLSVELLIAPFLLSVDYTFEVIPVIASVTEPAFYRGLLCSLWLSLVCTGQVSNGNGRSMGGLLDPCVALRSCFQSGFSGDDCVCGEATVPALRGVLYSLALGPEPIVSRGGNGNSLQLPYPVICSVVELRGNVVESPDAL